MGHSIELIIIITLSSQRRGRCKTISKGSVSAAMTINSDCPLFKVLVASFAPFLIFLKPAACCINSRISFCNFLGAKGKAFDLVELLLSFSVFS
jgi:hypothetical protein